MRAIPINPIFCAGFEPRYRSCYTAIMEIQVQPTPNPNARKFVLPQQEFAKPLSFSDAATAAAHPLAAALFDLGSIYNVFMVQDFVTVNKYPDAAWEPLEERIVAGIAAFFAARSPEPEEKSP